MKRIPHRYSGNPQSAALCGKQVRGYARTVPRRDTTDDPAKVKCPACLSMMLPLVWGIKTVSLEEFKKLYPRKALQSYGSKEKK